MQSPAAIQSALPSGSKNYPTTANLPPYRLSLDTIKNRLKTHGTKIFIFDIDDTILDADGKIINPDQLLPLLKIISKKHILVLATKKMIGLDVITKVLIDNQIQYCPELFITSNEVEKDAYFETPQYKQFFPNVFANGNDHLVVRHTLIQDKKLYIAEVLFRLNLRIAGFGTEGGLFSHANISIYDDNAVNCLGATQLGINAIQADTEDLLFFLRTDLIYALKQLRETSSTPNDKSSQSKLIKELTNVLNHASIKLYPEINALKNRLTQLFDETINNEAEFTQLLTTLNNILLLAAKESLSIILPLPNNITKIKLQQHINTLSKLLQQNILELQPIIQLLHDYLTYLVQNNYDDAQKLVGKLDAFVRETGKIQYLSLNNYLSFLQTSVNQMTAEATNALRNGNEFLKTANEKYVIYQQQYEYNFYKEAKDLFLQALNELNNTSFLIEKIQCAMGLSTLYQARHAIEFKKNSSKEYLIASLSATISIIDKIKTAIGNQQIDFSNLKDSEIENFITCLNRFITAQKSVLIAEIKIRPFSNEFKCLLVKYKQLPVNISDYTDQEAEQHSKDLIAELDSVIPLIREILGKPEKKLLSSFRQDFGLDLLLNLRIPLWSNNDAVVTTSDHRQDPSHLSADTKNTSSHFTKKKI